MNTSQAFLFESARMLRMAMQYVSYEGVEGDYAEFGVLEGRTFAEAWHAAQAFGLAEMRFRAFDSFAGLPTSEGPFRAGDLAVPRRTFEQTLRAHRVPPDRVEIVEGYFDDTLIKPASRPVAIAWIDCDLYESAVSALNHLGTALAHGAVVIFDDWFTHKGSPSAGEQRACQEWLRRHPGYTLTHYRDFHWAGRAFIFHRDDASRIS